MATKKTKTQKTELFQQETGWEKLTAADNVAMEKYCQDYISFLSKAKTERRAHDIALALAQKAGFRNLDDAKTLKPGDKVYRSCYGKTLFLAVIGKTPLEQGLNLVGAHIDSPRLDVKPRPLFEDSTLAYLDTRYYGGIKIYQWLTLPLALYGVIVKKDGSKVEVAIGDEPGDPVFMCTDLLPHLDRDQDATTVGKAFNGEKLNLLVGSRPVDKANDDKEVKDKTKLRILQLLKEKYGVEETDFASAELEIVPAGPARELGLDRSMVIGYGQDDRVCAYGALRAILDAKGVPSRTRATVICDKEEIGSYGNTGMDSAFIENSVAELVAHSTGGYNELFVRRALANSSMLSADVSALHDPMYADVSSPNNMAKMNCGIAICKYTGRSGKGGASDASAEFLAQVRRVFDEAGVAWQMSELGRVDCGGGGTIALYLARYGMNVLDCGVGLLCMHAPHEVAGKFDIYMGYRAYKAFFEA
ncbi:MAG: aminopeptidase [Victivallales bacterium]|nr:aminopeptidase [Victivallales bacterium]